MKISTLATKLTTLLFESCVEFSKKVSNDIKNETIYAFTIHCESGCMGMSVAISTQASIEKLESTKNEKYDQHNYVNVAEWAYIGLHDDLFSDINKFIQDMVNDFYEAEFEDVELDNLDEAEYQEFYNKFFTGVIINVIKKLKESNCFEKSIFEKDMLFGVQFSDPGIQDRYMIKEVSQHVNTHNWHAKVTEYCDFLDI